MLDDIIQITRYKTSDGREFDIKKEAEFHVETVIKMTPKYRKEVIERQKNIEDHKERHLNRVRDLEELKEAFKRVSSNQKHLKYKIAEQQQKNRYDNVSILTEKYNTGCCIVNSILNEIVKLKKIVNAYYPPNYHLV